MIMKKNIFLRTIIFILLLVVSNSLTAQILTDNVKGEITKALELWNATAKNSNVDQAISLFDDSENILLVGSDSGEVFKGKNQIKE